MDYDTMTPKDFYKTYQADPAISPLGWQLITLINNAECKNVLEFGCGEGKHLRQLRAMNIATFGIDLSILNVIRAQSQMDNFALGDENALQFFGGIDCVFTVSVLDHIEHIDEIINQFKRIAKKRIYLLETNDQPAPFYYPHDYESFGFTQVSKGWNSDGDGATYYIWELNVINYL